MQDLTRDSATGAKAYLVPSSMQGGNTVAGDPSLAMTAPGSASVLPVPDKLDNLPLPEYTPGPQIPVSFPGKQPRAQVQSAGMGNADWDDMHDVPAASRWKETS